MVIRFAKEMSSEDISRIKETKSKTEFYSAVLDFSFLYKEINLPERKRVNSIKTFITSYDESIVIKNIENAEPPTAWLIPCYKKEGIRIFEKINCQDYRPSYTFRFSLSNLYSKMFKDIDVLINLEEKNHYAPLELRMGYLSDPTQKKDNALHFVDFFYNRKELYTKIQKILLQNKEKIKKYTTKQFTKDFIGLFTVKEMLNGIQDIKDFDIFSSSENKKVLLNSGIQDPYKEITNEEIKISKQELKEDSSPDKFIKENLNNWLKNYVSIASFGAEIYKKMKTKVFISSI